MHELDEPAGMTTSMLQQEPEAGHRRLHHVVVHIDPRRLSSATACPNIGGWVIELKPRRPQKAAPASGAPK